MATMSLVFAVAVVLSFSRSAYLAILASCGVVVLYLCWLAQVRAAAKAAGIAVLCFLALLLVLEWVGALPAARIRLRSSADYQSLGDRRYQYPAAVRMLLENPLGVGLGRFTSEVGSYGGAERGGAHNDILAIAAESGFLGMGAVLLLIWTQLRQLAAGVRRAAGARSFLVAGFLAGTVSFWVHSFFHTSAHWVLVWIFFALGAEACRLAGTAETAGTPIQSRTYAGRREPTPRLGWRAWPGGAGARTTSAVGKRRKTGV
jgi:O-antigen ligase